MANNIIRIQDYTIKSSDVFFFDNNVWMYIFCPLGNYNKKKQGAYSKFLEYANQRKSPIFINSLVLSEFSNRYLRMDFDIERSKSENFGRFNNFKLDYMGSPQCNVTISEVKNLLKTITSLCERSSDEFNSIKIENIFSLFVSIGFNDSYYINQAASKKWIIVSDDSDLTSQKIPDKDITVLTYKL